ncbi:hypothetical protein [Comamonas sp. JC664]
MSRWTGSRRWRKQQGIQLATPEIGEVLTVGQPRSNKQWWEALR